MLILQGKLRAVARLGGHINKKTGEVVPVRDVIQVETVDDRGLVQLESITVPDPANWEGKVDQVVNVPVRAWAPGTSVRFVIQDARPGK